MKREPEYFIAKVSQAGEGERPPPFIEQEALAKMKKQQVADDIFPLLVSERKKRFGTFPCAKEKCR